MSQNTLSRFRLDGRVALVTGAARGIGAAVAEALAEAGASVVVTDRLKDVGEATVQRIKDQGGNAVFVALDVTVEDQWVAAVAAAQKHFGGLDVLVNNAGVETAALLTECTIEDFRNVMDINVTGVFLGMKHAARVMKAGASIVNLSSVAGIIGTPAHIAYHASKGAVRTMTKAGAVELAKLGTGIRVNSVHPAIVDTEMGSNFVQDFVNLGLAPDYASAEADIKSAHLLGRFGTPSDIAGAVIYLASDATSWMTGSELVIDGGFTAA
jgi:3alpha(or 20beta)-hydroxysteroid dehydrogenase